jgi:glycine/D-amino acid oxidase-like deaminating enzyme
MRKLMPGFAISFRFVYLSFGNTRYVNNQQKFKTRIMTQKVQVAVIGGGVVGCSVLYCLARLGYSDTLLLEKNELTSGSTWHAAGNATFFGHYSSITNLYVNSVNIYREAEAESGQSISFHAAGSIRIANNVTELNSYKKLQDNYRELGIPYEVIGPDRIETVHPLISTEGILGAAHTPTDGHLDAAGATQAVAKAARTRGAEIKRHTEVLDIRQHNDGWLLQTENDEILAKHVVMASSFWAREQGLALGLDIPVYAVKHQAIITDNIAALEALDFEVPTIRDSYGQYNMRQEGSGLLGAVYEPDPEFWAVDGIPPEFNQQLFEPQLGRIEIDMERVFERVPAFGEAGIKQIINGPICYTPDALPLLGPVESHPGLWLATGFCVGIGTGGGSADFLANWIVNGKPPYELPIVYPSRFQKSLTQQQYLDSIRQIYKRGYGVVEKGLSV